MPPTRFVRLSAMTMPTHLQDRVDQLRSGKFLGVQFDNFERTGREQLIFLLMCGLTPNSTLVDIGCGVLRAGYWLIHFLDTERYCGIEPSKERLSIGLTTVLEPETIQLKRPRFDHNPHFDTSVFNERFDYFLAYSIWTHAAKRHISMMLDNFLRDAKPDAVFLTTILPAGWRRPDYREDVWMGTSHESDTPGCIYQDLAWIKRECRRRDLSVYRIGKDRTMGQTWLRIARRDSSPRIADIRFQPRWKRVLERLRGI